VKKYEWRHFHVPATCSYGWLEGESGGPGSVGDKIEEMQELGFQLVKIGEFTEIHSSRYVDLLFRKEIPSDTIRVWFVCLDNGSEAGPYNSHEEAYNVYINSQVLITVTKIERRWLTKEEYEDFIEDDSRFGKIGNVISEEPSSEELSSVESEDIKDLSDSYLLPFTLRHQLTKLLI